MAWRSMAVAQKGLAPALSSVEVHGLSVDELGRRMAMKRHSLATMSKAWAKKRMAAAVRRLVMQRHCIALLGKGNVSNCYATALL